MIVCWKFGKLHYVFIMYFIIINISLDKKEKATIQRHLLIHTILSVSFYGGD